MQRIARGLGAMPCAALVWVLGCGPSERPQPAPAPAAAPGAATRTGPTTITADDLLARIGGNDPKAAARAAADLSHAGGHDAALVSALVGALDPSPQPWTLTALARLGPRAAAARSALTAVVGNETHPAPVRGLAIDALGDTAGISGLVAACGECSDTTRRRVLDRLSKALDDPVTPAQAAAATTLLRRAMAKPSLRLTAILALGKLGPAARDAAPAMARLLRVANAETQIQIAYALGSIGATSVADDLLAIIDTPAPALRYPAARALGCIGDRSIVGRLVERLSSQSDPARLIAIDALALQGTRAGAAVDSLIPILREADARFVTAAAEALGRIGSAASAAAPLLRVTMAASGDPDVRKSVATALSRIAGTQTIPARSCPGTP